MTEVPITSEITEGAVLKIHEVFPCGLQAVIETLKVAPCSGTVFLKRIQNLWKTVVKELIFLQKLQVVGMRPENVTWKIKLSFLSFLKI